MPTASDTSEFAVPRHWIRSLALALAWLPVAGCAITRTYIGAPIPADPNTIIAGVTRMDQVLSELGAPNRIVRGPSGEIFIYRFMRRNSDTFTVEEPVITDIEIFSYSVIEEREDRLVVLFDGTGTVLSFGVRRGTPELD